MDNDDDGNGEGREGDKVETDWKRITWPWVVLNREKHVAAIGVEIFGSGANVKLNRIFIAVNYLEPLIANITVTIRPTIKDA